MGKRRLRNCARCGTRHGPPTGKGCTRLEEDFDRKNDEMGSEIAESREKTASDSERSEEEQAKPKAQAEDEEVNWSIPEFPNSGETKGEEVAMGRGSKQAESARAERGGSCQSSAWAVPEPSAAWERAYQDQRQSGPSTFDRDMGLRMSHMENVMGHMAGIQQSQFDQIIRLAESFPVPPSRVPAGGTANQRPGTTSASVRQPLGSQPAADHHRGTAPSTSSQSGARAAASAAHPFQLPPPSWAPPGTSTNGGGGAVEDDSVSGTDDDEPNEWKEFYGPTLWKKEQEKKRKNPFDQKNFGKKGESVNSFEKLMAITFRTIDQLLTWGCEVKGIVKHGLSMSEKAEKDVYETEAFVSYDASVRDRAGQVGPSAFGAVEQEDVMRFFCFDNTKKSGKQTSKGSSNKKDKICLRYNDGGCNAKNCVYAHKCAACLDWGHPRKDCRSLKKKDSK